jgi:pimeloyl-ACP methyl ester carboxylesterase
MTYLEHLIARPAARTHAAPILLLHGAWHGAWCWEAAMADLAGRGFEAHAVSLRGHGASDPAGPRTTVLDYARDARAAIAAAGPRPVVVGHSSGGYVLQMLITGALGPPPPIAGAVLLCSSPPDIGAYFSDRGRRGVRMPSLRGLIRREPEAVRFALFRPDTPAAEIERHRLRLVAEPPLVTLSSMLLRPRPPRSRTPVLVVAAGRDTVFDVEAQLSTAALYGAGLVVVPEAPHDLMLDPAWPQAADAIARFAAALP